MTYNPSADGTVQNASDTPVSLAGQAGNALIVNPGENAYEHGAGGGGGGGGDLQAIQRYHNIDFIYTAALTVINFNVSFHDTLPDMTWDGVNFDFTASADILLQCHLHVVSQLTGGTANKPNIHLQLDTGGGFVDMGGGRLSRMFADQSGGRHDMGGSFIIELSIGDKIRWVVTAIAPQTQGVFINCSTNLLKLGGGVAPGQLPNLSDGVEVATGRVFNGQPTFVTLVDLGALPNIAIKLVNHGITGAVTWVKLEGMASDGTNIIPLPYATAISVANNVGIALTSTQISIETGVNLSTFTGRIFIEYTKT